MIKLPNWLNPWRDIRALRADVAALEALNEELYRRCDEAERDAFYRAADHYQMRTRALEASHARLLEQAAQMSSLANPKLVIDTSTWGALANPGFKRPL